MSARIKGGKRTNHNAVTEGEGQNLSYGKRYTRVQQVANILLKSRC